MAEFFKLSEPIAEKIVDCSELIYSDATVIRTGEINSVVVPHNFSHSLRMKIFIDVIAYSFGGETRYTKVGKYFELENGQIIKLITSLDVINLYYNCVPSIEGEQEFKFYTTTGQNISIFASGIKFVDSFYQKEKGWLQPENENNIIANIFDGDDEYINNVSREWIENELVKYLPLQGGTMQGNINMDYNRIVGLQNPFDADEVVNLSYLREQIYNTTAYTDDSINLLSENIYQTISEIETGVNSEQVTEMLNNFEFESTKIYRQQVGLYDINLISLPFCDPYGNYFTITIGVELRRVGAVVMGRTYTRVDEVSIGSNNFEGYYFGTFQSGGGMILPTHRLTAERISIPDDFTPAITTSFYIRSPETFNYINGPITNTFSVPVISITFEHSEGYGFYTAKVEKTPRMVEQGAEKQIPEIATSTEMKGLLSALNNFTFCYPFSRTSSGELREIQSVQWI